MTLFTEMLNGENIHVQSITAFYNPTWVESFIHSWAIANKKRKADASLVLNANANASAIPQEREWILAEYDRKVNYYDWNNALHLPIIPCMTLFRVLFEYIFVCVHVRCVFFLSFFFFFHFFCSE
jgi:hypothetical protein